MIPPEQSGEFVWHMEDVLDVYERPYDPQRPVLCLDETTTQLVAETRTPVPMAPGQVARFDYEYERRGVSTLFMVCEPLTGWRHVTVTDRRTKADWARFIQQVVEVHYPDAETIVLVEDTLTTHTPAALYETFPPAEARRLANKLERHFTPKHGSWLTIAEIELSVLGRQCLAARIPDPATLTDKVTDWHTSRNAKRGSVRWRFTTKDARIKLHRLYPLIPV